MDDDFRAYDNHLRMPQAVRRRWLEAGRPELGAPPLIRKTWAPPPTPSTATMEADERWNAWCREIARAQTDALADVCAEELGALERRLLAKIAELETEIAKLRTVRSGSVSVVSSNGTSARPRDVA
ncbi:MAG: hypothetical protein ACXWKB_08335 [Methyloceanibacter sp.]